MKLFIIWTTFICNNGELPDIQKRKKGEQIFFSRSLYSSKIYTKKSLNEGKSRWRKNYTNERLNNPLHCSAFMLQHEEVSQELLLKQILRFK